jgi:hypothetical protein
MLPTQWQWASSLTIKGGVVQEPKTFSWPTSTCAPGVQRDPNKSESTNKIPNCRYKTESNCATECHQWRCEYKYDMTRDSVPLTNDSLVITLMWDFQWPSFNKPIRTQHMSCSRMHFWSFAQGPYISDLLANFAAIHATPYLKMKTSNIFILHPT